MLNCLALVVATSTQGGTSALVPDQNRYVLKAENQPPMLIEDFPSHPGLFSSIEKPLTIRFRWTRPVMQWLRWSTQKPGKLRLDRISPTGKVVASFDLSSRYISRIRLSDGLTTAIQPIVTLAGPPVAPVNKNADPQPTDDKIFSIKGWQFAQSVAGKTVPMDWAIFDPREFKAEGTPGAFTLRTIWGFKPGKSQPNPMPNSITIRIDLKASGQPTNSVLFFAHQPALKRNQGTNTFSLTSKFAYGAGEFP